MAVKLCFNRCLCLRVLRPPFSRDLKRHVSLEVASAPEETIRRGRRVPKTREDYLRRRKDAVVQPEEPKLIRAAIIGLPNSGKSTLMNQLVEHRISSVSTKVHTTRKNVIGVFCEGSTQVEFLDTPGLVSLDECAKHSLEHSLYHHPLFSASVADIIVVLVDVSRKIYRRFLSMDTYKILSSHRDKKSVLVLNKVDLVTPKRKLIYCVDRLTGGYIEGRSVDGQERRYVKQPVSSDKNRLKKIFERAKEREAENSDWDSSEETDLLDRNIDPRSLHWPYFSRVFMISALTDDGVDDLRKYLISEAKPNPWKYPDSLVTCESPENIVISTVREKFLDHCCWDIPYLLRFKLDEWVVDDLGNLHLIVRVLAPKENHMAFILGGKGSTISKVADEARQDLADTFRCDVRLKLLVVCTEYREKKANQERLKFPLKPSQ